MKKVITDEMIEQMVHEVLGTCSTPEYMFNILFPEYDVQSITAKQWSLYDELAYTCAGCGWVFEAGMNIELDDEMYCENCAEDFK